MLGRRKDPIEDELRRAPDRSWSTRIAWVVLVGGGALIGARATLATVVQVHGDGMAPTIVDGDTVLLVRGKWSVSVGDVVVYDSAPPAPERSPGAAPVPTPGDDRETGRPDARKPAIEPMRNTAVVDQDELDGNWERVKSKSGVGAAVRSLRVGRVIAAPGDTVTFNVEDAALGLSVNGTPVRQKPGEPLRIVLRGEPVLGEDRADVERARIRATAFESIGDVRYSVLTNVDEGAAWTELALPPEVGPVQVQAPGYLILADNRHEGACCDSRAIGWVSPANVRGEVVARLAGNPTATPDLDPRARGLSWLP